MGQIAGNLAHSTNGTEIQVLSITTEVAKLTASGTTSSAALPTGVSSGKLMRLATTEDCYIKFGGSGVTATATDTLFPAGVEILQCPTGATYIAVIQVSTGGPVTVTGLD